MKQINTNARKRTELFYPELSFIIVGMLFSVHNDLGPWAREKQFGDLLEKKLKEAKVTYIRECPIGTSGNIIDFIVDNKIILELKAKRILTKEDYEQVQRYLQATQLKLAILVNFRNKYIKPVRIVKIDEYNHIMN